MTLSEVREAARDCGEGKAALGGKTLLEAVEWCAENKPEWLIKGYCAADDESRKVCGIDRFNKALSDVARNGGALDLRSLKTLPDGVVLPKECGTLDLSSLETLPDSVVFPEECGALDLSSLKTLPDSVVLPKNTYAPMVKK